MGGKRSVVKAIWIHDVPLLHNNNDGIEISFISITSALVSC